MRRIAGSAEGTAFAAGGRGGGAGRRAQRENTTAGDLDSALLPAPDKRKERDAWRGADADTSTGTETAAVTTSVSPSGLQPLESMACKGRLHNCRPRGRDHEGDGGGRKDSLHLQEPEGNVREAVEGGLVRVWPSPLFRCGGERVAEVGTKNPVVQGLEICWKITRLCSSVKRRNGGRR